MPGLLKPDAKCPRCGGDLVAIADITSTAQVERLYYHAKGSPRARRCRFVFTDYAKAVTERCGLEVQTCDLPPFVPGRPEAGTAGVTRRRRLLEET